jgi:hypothetical protein
MSERLRQMERVKKVRSARERLSEVSTARAAAQLRDAEVRLAGAKEAELQGAGEAMRAMEAGERGEWPMSLALCKVLGIDRERMERERVEREKGLAAAQILLRANRVETEQAAVLHRDMRKALLVEQERRAQTETEDRFLARRRWSSQRARVRGLIESA